MKVALYLRRSTNERLQADSLKVQEQILRAYARDHDMEVVETFVDSATGTSTKHRVSFLRMVERITHGPRFAAVLVRDVTRFGRFFDVDEGAFYEVLFLGHGVKTVYCEEVFSSDTSPMATLVKSVRRVMASEYSRDRSRLVRCAQSRATRLGFHAGGPPPFGMRRVMVTPGGRHVQDLARGEWKALANHRTRLVAGDPESVAIVRGIFDLYDRDGLSVTAIVSTLNGTRVLSPEGSRWYESSVLDVLTNSRYAGLGRYRPKRHGLSDPLPASQVEDLAVWDAAGPEAIIDVAQFRRAEARLNKRTSRRSSQTLASEARAALEMQGCVEPAMLDRLPEHCSWGTYKRRFVRGVDEALELAFATEIADRTTKIRDLLLKKMDLSQGDGVWTADGTIRVFVQAAFPHRRPTGLFWLVRRPAVKCDVVIAPCIDGKAGSCADDLIVVRSDQLASRPRGLYLRCGGGSQTQRFSVAKDDLAAHVARMRYTSRGPSEERMLREARGRPVVNFAELARTLDWPYHIVRTMYWRLLARGEWFPPLERRAGRLVEVVCSRCGKSRSMAPTRAFVLKSDLCFACATKRPRNLTRIQCPQCRRVAMREPSAVRKLSRGAETLCRTCCRKRHGRKG